MVVIIMALKSQFFKFLLIYLSLTLHYSQLPDKIMVLFLIVFFFKKYNNGDKYGKKRFKTEQH